MSWRYTAGSRARSRGGPLSPAADKCRALWDSVCLPASEKGALRRQCFTCRDSQNNGKQPHPRGCRQVWGRTPISLHKYEVSRDSWTCQVHRSESSTTAQPFTIWFISKCFWGFRCLLQNWMSAWERCAVTAVAPSHLLLSCRGFLPSDQHCPPNSAG